MAQVTSIHPADLRTIENNLGAIENNLSTIYEQLESLDSQISLVDGNVKTVYSELSTLAREFQEYVQAQTRQNKKQVAHTELIRVRQELDKKYGHYDTVRRMTTGILQADDLGVVRKETISTSTEEVMITTPGYWLAPCLVALSAWINDKPDLAEIALREGIKRNDEKTSLFFALVCRRAGRFQAALKWTQRYLANQDEKDLDRHAIVILNAFAEGLLGNDSEGAVSRQIGEWLERLSDEPGFIERQTYQWSLAINAKRGTVPDDLYPSIRSFSPTWGQLKYVLEGARLHTKFMEYFNDIFKQASPTEGLKQQLDEILNGLVSDFDDEELPLRREEMLNQLIIDYDGDEGRAKQVMAAQQSALEEGKDFTQLLTDAAMTPDESSASVSTQKFAIALSRDWIVTAYNDVTAQNRAQIPNEIELKIGNFAATTTDGHNESELLMRYQDHVNKERQEALAQFAPSSFEQFALYGGAVICVVGLIMMVTGNAAFGLLVLIAGVGLVLHYFTKKKAREQGEKSVNEQCDKKLATGQEAIRAVLAEVVDYRREFAKEDAVSDQVIGYLKGLTPKQFVRQVERPSRRIDII